MMNFNDHYYSAKKILITSGLDNNYNTVTGITVTSSQK